MGQDVDSSSPGALGHRARGGAVPGSASPDPLRTASAQLPEHGAASLSLLHHLWYLSLCLAVTGSKSLLREGLLTHTGLLGTVSALKHAWMGDWAGPLLPTGRRLEGWPQRFPDPSSGDPPPLVGLLAQLGLSNPSLTHTQPGTGPGLAGLLAEASEGECQRAHPSHTILAASDFEVHHVGLQEEPLGGRRRAALLVQGGEAQIWSCFLLNLTSQFLQAPQ